MRKEPFISTISTQWPNGVGLVSHSFAYLCKKISRFAFTWFFSFFHFFFCAFFVSCQRPVRPRKSPRIPRIRARCPGALLGRFTGRDIHPASSQCVILLHLAVAKFCDLPEKDWVNYFPHRPSLKQRVEVLRYYIKISEVSPITVFSCFATALK